MIRIAGLGGSLKERSTSLTALRYALKAVEAQGAATELFDVRELDLPLFVPGRALPPALVHFVEATYAASGLVWSTPMYHGTVSGSFKNALDWLELLGKREPAYLTGKPVALISAAGGVQAVQAINALEHVVRALRGYTVPLVVPIAKAYEAFDSAGEPKDPKLADSLTRQARELVRMARLVTG